MDEKQRNLSLVLEIDGKETRFVTPKRIPGSLWREAALVAEEIESGKMGVADLDSHLQFVCDVFGNQFNLAELENGIDARDIVKTVYAVVIFIMGQVSTAAKMLTENVDISEEDEKKT